MGLPMSAPTAHETEGSRVLIQATFHLPERFGPPIIIPDPLLSSLPAFFPMTHLEIDRPEFIGPRIFVVVSQFFRRNVSMLFFHRIAQFFELFTDKPG